MELVIVTGMSGSGKSVAINALEDLGYYCVDNLPPQFILPFAKLSIGTKGREEKLALVVDARSKDISRACRMRSACWMRTTSGIRSCFWMLLMKHF